MRNLLERDISRFSVVKGAFVLLKPAVALSMVLTGSGSALAAERELAPNDLLPIRGLHLGVPGKKDLKAAVAFIREVLPKEGVNTLVLEFDYDYDFRSRPEFANSSALGSAEVKEIVGACREKGIELIPQINCLGHQSWATNTGRLLQKHPEFDETPGKFPGNTNIYCRSYCPLHPEVHRVLFDLIDELARACEAKAFHVGMDEVFIVADPDCPRCGGKSPAEVFATEVKALDAHLKDIHCRMWMWGDRFLDGETTGLGKWEASENDTQGALELVPKDIVICDWHYDVVPETARFFATNGFDVVECPWRKTNVALDELQMMRGLQRDPEVRISRRALGIMATTWCGFARFAHAYKEQSPEPEPGNKSAWETARCFRALFQAMREPAK